MEYVLVLNTSFEPLLVVHWHKAMVLLFQGKVEVLEEYEREIRTVSRSFRMPAVLRLIKFIPMTRRKNTVRFSRPNVFLRDNHTCQYCGRKRAEHELTLDHVVPAVQGGMKTWENIVSACIQCNQRKGGRTPIESGMKLIARPTKPNWLPTEAQQISPRGTPQHWHAYLPWGTGN